MELLRVSYSDRESWLAGRNNGIGASDAAAIVGANPWMSSVELWQLKCGLKPAKDLSGNAAVEQGHRLEAPLRNLYISMHPEYTLEYHEFDVLAQSDRPWLTATLDGELMETATGRKGIYEGKTGLCGKRTDWERWQNQIPRHYYVQILHQMLATGWDFVVLFALLLNLEGDGSIRAYQFDRDACEDDLNWLLEKERVYWPYIQKRQMPPMILTF